MIDNSFLLSFLGFLLILAPLVFIHELGHYLASIKSGVKVVCQKERSQHLNKKQCLKELRVRLNKINYKPTKRRLTRPTKKSIEKRLTTKKINSEKKKHRKNIRLTDVN